MNNVDVAHLLMLQATLPTSSGLSSQQIQTLKFLTVLHANSYRVWNIYRNCDEIMCRIRSYKFGDQSALQTTVSVCQLLCLFPFHCFLEENRDMFITISKHAIIIT